jgi:hypothetical protein
LFFKGISKIGILGAAAALALGSSLLAASAANLQFRSASDTGNVTNSVTTSTTTTVSASDEQEESETVTRESESENESETESESASESETESETATASETESENDQDEDNDEADDDGGAAQAEAHHQRVVQEEKHEEAEDADELRQEREDNDPAQQFVQASKLAELGAKARHGQEESREHASGHARKRAALEAAFRRGDNSFTISERERESHDSESDD